MFHSHGRIERIERERGREKNIPASHSLDSTEAEGQRERKDIDVEFREAVEQSVFRKGSRQRERERESR